jgi:hypothetical protein
MAMFTMDANVIESIIGLSWILLPMIGAVLYIRKDLKDKDKDKK